MELCSKDKCTACGACVSSCPKGCIKFEQDKYGFIYPVIDNDLCVECGKCKQSCHIIKDLEMNYPQKAYAVWSNDENDRKTSTSGGAASVFYKTVVNNNGICYGATFDDNLKVVIKGYDDDRIIKFKNSKYVHSDMTETFKTLKSDLQDGKPIIFIGLPCQVAAIKAFVGKDYDNLILVDLICHGTPPNQYLYEHIKNIEDKYKKPILEIRFREDNDYKFMCFDDKRDKPYYKMTKNADAYLFTFFNAVTYKEGCYQCKYAQNNRVSDITIGDFWGLGQKVPFEHPYTGAISLVLLNNKKGKDFFELCKDKLFVEERPVEEGINGNDQLNRPSKKNSHREEFLQLYPEKGFDGAVESIYSDYMKVQKRLYKKQNIKSSIRKIVKKVLRK